mmetsp:Transcript_3213/g.12879  ORF Transcript_3213/g.12879 Transcript_3213/m.12879 type:complete len:287 (-) Transcript_3213:2-862(-)
MTLLSSHFCRHDPQYQHVRNKNCETLHPRDAAWVDELRSLLVGAMGPQVIFTLEVGGRDLVKEVLAQPDLTISDSMHEVLYSPAVRQLVLVVLSVHEPDASVLVEAFHYLLVLVERNVHQDQENLVKDLVDRPFVLGMRDGEVSVQFVVEPRLLGRDGGGAGDDRLRRFPKVHSNDRRVGQMEFVLDAHYPGAAHDLAPSLGARVVGEDHLATLDVPLVRVRIIVGRVELGGDRERLLRVPKEVHVADVKQVQHVLHDRLHAALDVHAALNCTELLGNHLRVGQGI